MLQPIKMYSLLGFLLMIFLSKGYAQAPEQDCINALPICQNLYFTQVAYSGTGAITNEIDTSISCLKSGEKNDVWYTFTVQTSGNLSFLITPNNLSDDYDWAVYNLTGQNCAAIFSNPSLSVSCNYSSTFGATGPNGINNLNSAGALDPPYCAFIPVLAGESYVINVSNFTASQSGYQIDFSGSTAQIFDNVAPQLMAVTAPSVCGENQLTFQFSENIQYSSIQDADFTLTGPAGNYLLSNWASSAPVSGTNYGKTFTLQVSPAMVQGAYSFSLVNSAGSVNDLCGNIALLASFSFNVSGITANITETDVLCNGGSSGTAQVSPLSGTIPFTYSWSNGGSTAIIQNLPAGSYTVTATDANGCEITKTSQVIEPLALLISETHSDVTCFGGLNGSATISVQGGSMPFSFQWNGQAGGNATNPNLPAGQNQVIVSDLNGCNSTIQFIIGQPTAIAPVISASFSDTLCAGQSMWLNATATGGTPSYTYNWNNGVYSEDSILIHPATTTVYQLVAADSLGCTSQPVTFTVYVRQPLSVQYNAPAVCSGDSSRLTMQATGGDGNYNYLLNPGNLSGNQLSLLADTTITYIITVNDGCKSSPSLDTVRFHVNPRPVSNFTMDITEGCAPLCINLSDSSTISAGQVASWYWNMDGLESASQNPYNCFNQSGKRSIRFVAISDKGCVGDTITKKVKVFARPEASFGVDKDTRGVFHATFHFTDSSANAVAWSWNFGDPNDLTEKTIKNPYHTYSDTGSYTVTLIVFNAKGCTDTITQVVEVLPVSKMFLPDAFTPNGDGVNDVFSLKGMFISEADITILDRWGQVVYQSNSIDAGWDGTFHGAELPVGVYAYIARLKGSDSKNVVQEGIVTLVR